MKSGMSDTHLFRMLLVRRSSFVSQLTSANENKCFKIQRRMSNLEGTFIFKVALETFSSEITQSCHKSYLEMYFGSQFHTKNYYKYAKTFIKCKMSFYSNCSTCKSTKFEFAHDCKYKLNIIYRHSILHSTLFACPQSKQMAFYKPREISLLLVYLLTHMYLQFNIFSPSLEISFKRQLN